MSEAMTIIDENLLYIPTYQVVICLPCQYCIRPGGVYEHLRREHHTMTRHMRKELEDYCSKLDLIEPELVKIPTDRTRIDGLRVSNGQKCQVEGCSDVCGKQSQAEKHARTHGWTTSKPNTWTKQSVQVCII